MSKKNKRDAMAEASAPQGTTATKKNEGLTNEQLLTMGKKGQINFLYRAGFAEAKKNGFAGYDHAWTTDEEGKKVLAEKPHSYAGNLFNYKKGPFWNKLKETVVDAEGKTIPNPLFVNIAKLAGAAKDDILAGRYTPAVKEFLNAKFTSGGLGGTKGARDYAKVAAASAVKWEL